MERHFEKHKRIEQLCLSLPSVSKQPKKGGLFSTQPKRGRGRPPGGRNKKKSQDLAILPTPVTAHSKVTLSEATEEHQDTNDDVKDHVKQVKSLRVCFND